MIDIQSALSNIVRVKLIILWWNLINGDEYFGF